MYLRAHNLPAHSLTSALMGTAISSFRGQMTVQGGMLALPDPARRFYLIDPRGGGRGAEGTVVTATALGDGRQFKIELISLNAVAEGASAAVLKGRIIPTPDTKSLVVALKVFRIPLIGDEKERYHKLYIRELEAAQRLGVQDRFILPFLGTSVLGVQPVIISQFMGNGNVLEYIKKCQPFQVRRQMLIIQVAEAIEFLHTKARLVHGDLKCENVMISDSGTALLADMGLSTVMDKAEWHATTTTGVRQWNTVRFAAPELLVDNAVDNALDNALTSSPNGSKMRVRSKTSQSDMYAFGMLILQTFTGKHPWPGCSSDIVVMKMLSPQRPVHPRPGGDITALGLTDPWWHVCMACWEYDPRDRLPIGRALKQLRSTERPDHVLLSGHSDWVRAVAFLPCGTRVVSGSDDKTLRIWDTSTRRLVLGPLIGHEAWIVSVAVSPDGRQIVSGCNEGTIRRWDAQTGKQLGAPMNRHTRSVTCLAYSHDSRYIVSGSADRTLRLWAAHELRGSRVLLLLLRRHSEAVLSVAVSCDGETVASASGCRIFLTSITRECGGYLEGHTEPVQSVRFTPGGQHLISGSHDRTIRIWIVATHELKFTLDAHGQSARTVSILSSCRSIASALRDKTIRIWDARSGRMVGSLFGHTDQIEMIESSPDGKTLVSSSRDRTVRIWGPFA